MDSSPGAAALEKENQIMDGFQSDISDFASSSVTDSNDEFSWVQRLQHIPDKVTFLPLKLKSICKMLLGHVTRYVNRLKGPLPSADLECLV